MMSSSGSSWRSDMGKPSAIQQRPVTLRGAARRRDVLPKSLERLRPPLAPLNASMDSGSTGRSTTLSSAG